MAIIDPGHAAKQLVYERIFRTATISAAFLVLLILGGVAVSLLRGAWPALRHFGFGFVTREIWNPVTDEYGALAPIYGTVVTSLIAMALAVPTGVRHRAVLDRTVSAAAQAPHRRRGGTAGGRAQHHFRHLGTFRPGAGAATPRATLAHRACPRYSRHSQAVHGTSCSASGFFTAGIVLAIMVLPFIAATMRDVFDTVPPMLKESGYGLGATTWEVIWNVVVPQLTRRRGRRSHVGGWGRALGETMAVTFVIGNAHRISTSLLGARHDDFLGHRQ